MAGRRSLTTPLSGPRRKRPNRRLERSARTYAPNLVEGVFSEVYRWSGFRVPVRSPHRLRGGMTVQPNEIAEVLNRPLSQELLARDLTRLAYVAKDGTPRNVPIGFTWNGAEIVMCTSNNAPKLQALSENPMVALTIDTEVHPPKILLIRGRAELDFVDGIPDE